MTAMLPAAPTPRKTIEIGVVCTVLGAFAGGFLNWSATERRLTTHMALADDRVAMMCQLADYSAASDDYRNDVSAATCVATLGEKNCPKKPQRPDELRREVLARRCQ